MVGMGGETVLGANTACVVLAAGHSRRWGPENKLLAPWRGRSLACHTADLLQELSCRWRGAVCRNDAVAACFPDIHRLSPDGDEQSGSLHSAVRFALACKADHLLILLADMPDLTIGDVTRVLCAATDDRPAAAIHADDRVGPPACFPRSMFARMLAIKGDTGAGRLLHDAVRIRIPTNHLIDVDRPDVDRPMDIVIADHRI